MSRLVKTQPRDADMLDEALDLIEDHFRGRPMPRQASDTELDALLDEALKRRVTPNRIEPVRVVRQFACTGGTLICRGLQAQPNITLLSEADPFNTAHLARKKPAFAPTDLIQLADSRLRPLQATIKADIFAASLTALHAALSKQGRRLIVREHSHGRFCTDADWTTRGSALSVIEAVLPVQPVVTVRHPIDSWASLIANDWRHFEPFTLEEYARRYMAFLDDCGAAPVFKYEDFVDKPEQVMTALCETLDLKFNDSWQALLPVITMSGDSGRAGARIEAREPRPVSAEMQKEVRDSETMAALCARLGYGLDS